MFPRLGRLNLSTALVLAAASNACNPELVVGKINTEDPCAYEGAAGAPAADKVIEIGWSTGFDNGECDYERAGGDCYTVGNASFTFVDDPVHTGPSAAAFTVTTDMDGNITGVPHTRCYLEGVMPTDAVYGAWFYIPEAARTGNWNLMFFQATVYNPGLFSVSLSSEGGLHLYVLNHMTGAFRTPDPAPVVPIATWFQIEFRLLRARDATGGYALYQDRMLLLEESGIVTDRYDVHQWYVGNWADELMPAESTVYVDDVTVSAEPAGQ